MLVLLALAAPTTPAAEERVLFMGAIHDDPLSTRARLTPMANYVKSRLEDLGVAHVYIVTAGDRDEMLNLLRYGRVDWLSETAYNAIVIEDADRAEIVARTWRSGSPTYRTKFFVNRDSAIETLYDLPGATIAFEQPGSTSAYFAPAVELVNRAIPLCRLDDPRSEHAGDCIGFAFSKRSFNTAAWVHKAIVDVGVFSNVDWESEQMLPPGFKRDFRVFHETDPIPRGVELLRKGLDADIRERLVEVLLDMHADPAALEALAAYYGTRKFDRLTEADSEALERLRVALPLFDRSVN